MFRQVIYTSTTNRSLSNEEVASILKSSVANNLKSNITGILLYGMNRFIQVLEGEDEVIEKVVLTIIKDSRHQNIQIIDDVYKPEREFKNWSMGFKSFDKSDFSEIDSINNFFAEIENIGENTHNLSDSVKEMMYDFREYLLLHENQ